MKIENINDDCLENIFSFLDLTNRIRVQPVCVKWRSLIRNQFRREKNLLISSDALNATKNLIYYNYSHYQDRLNDSYSYLQSIKNIENSSPTFIEFKSDKDQSDYSILKLSFSSKLSCKLNNIQFNCIISKFINVKSLAFRSGKNFEFVTPELLNVIIKECRLLVRIDLSNCREVNNDCLNALSKCSNLKYVDLSNCRRLGNKGFKLLLRKCSKLIGLYIGYNRRLTGQFFRNCVAKLKYLDLTECTNFASKGLNALQTALGNEIECLITQPILTNESLEFICTKFSNLRKLKLSLQNESLKLNILIENTQLTKLRSLSLHGLIRLDDQTLYRMMFNLKQINEFEYRPNQRYKTVLTNLDCLSRYWINLTRLCLFSVFLDSEQNKSLLDSIKNFKHLEHLFLCLTKLREADVLLFLKDQLNRKKIKYLNLEYFQSEPESDLGVRTYLNEFKKLNYDTSINQLKLNKLSSSLYLIKLKIVKLNLED